MNAITEFAAESELTAALHAIRDAEQHLQTVVRRSIDAGMTAQAVAEVLGVSRVTVFRIARGEHVERVSSQIHRAYARRKH